MFDAGSAAVVLTGIVVREPFQNYGRLIAEAERHKEHRIALGARTDSAGFTKFNTELDGIQRNLRQTVASAKGSWDEIAAATTRMTAATDRDLANMRRSLGLTADGYGRLGGASKGVADEVARANERMAAAARARARAENVAADESVRADEKIAAAAGGAGRGGGGRSAAAAASAGAASARDARQATAAWEKGFNAMATFGKWVTAGIVGVGAISIKTAADFQRQMELVHTQAGYSQQSVDKLKKSVLDLAPAVGVGPTELAKGLFHIASEGIPASKAIDVLKFAAEGAKVGMANLEDVTNALTAVWKSQPKDIHSVSEAMGVMNDIVGKGNLRMEDLAKALGTGIVAAAKNAHLGFRDVGAALDTMTSRGIPAEQAATRLRTTLSLMASPTTKATKALQEVGLSSTQLAQDMERHGLVFALQDLQKHLTDTFGTGNKLSADQMSHALATFTQELQNAGEKGKKLKNDVDKYKISLETSGDAAIKSSQLITQAFGGSRMGTTMALLMQNIGDVQKHFNDLNKADAAGRFQKAWEATKKDFSVQVAQMWAGVQKLGITIGDYLIPKVKDLVNWLVHAADWMGKHKVLLHDLEILFGTVLVAAIAAFFARLAKGIAGGIADIGRMGKAIYDLPLKMTAAGRQMIEEQQKIRAAVDETTAALDGQAAAAGESAGAGGAAGGALHLGPLEGMINGIRGTMAPGSEGNPLAVFVVDQMGGGGSRLLGPKGEPVSSGRGAAVGAAEGAAAEQAIVAEAEGPTGKKMLSRIGGFASSAMRGVMRGAMVGVGGFLLTDVIASQFHGGISKAITNIGHDASIGAGIGMMFGPEGAAAGAIIGGLAGTIDTFTKTHAQSEGEKWAKGFGSGLGNLIPASTLQNTRNQLNRLISDATKAGDQSHRQAPSGGGHAAPSASGPPAFDPAQWNRWFNDMYKAGQTGAQSFEKAFNSVRFKSTPAFVEGAISTLKGLPPAARKWAAESMIQYASELQKQGKLPKGSVDRVITALENQFKGLGPFLRSRSEANAKEVAQQFKFTQATNNVRGWISGLRNQFGLFNTDANLTGKNWAKNYRITIQDLTAFSMDKSSGISGPALAALKELKTQGKRYLDALKGEFDASIPAMAADINNHIPGAVKNAIGAFGNFKSHLDDLVKAGIIPAKEEARLLTGRIDDLLKRFKDPIKRLTFKIALDFSQGNLTGALQNTFNLIGKAISVGTVGGQSALSAHRHGRKGGHILNLEGYAGGGVTDATSAGYLHGPVPGSPHKDGTLAMLSGKEFVLTGDGQSIMERMAPGLLDFIERHQKPHFQAGGPVGSPASLAAGSRASASVSVHIDDSMRKDAKRTGAGAMADLASAIKGGARKVEDEAKKPADAVHKLFNDNIKTKLPQLAKQGLDAVDKRFHDVKYDDDTKKTTDTVTKAWTKLKTDATKISKDTTDTVDKNWKGLHDNLTNKYAPQMTKSVHDETSKQEQQVKQSTGKAKDEGSSNWQKLSDNTGHRFDDMSSHVDKKSQDMLNSVKGKTSDADKQGQSNMDKLETAIYSAIDAGVSVTSSGITKIATDLNSALKTLGGGHVSIPKLDSTVGHNPLHHEGGGKLPGTEFGLQDNMTLVDPFGIPRARMAGDEAVFSRHQQPFVDAGLRAIGFKGGKEELWNKVKTPHYLATGGLLPGFASGGQWVRTGATIDPTQGQAPTYSAHGGFSFAELLEAGSNAGMRPDLTQLLGEPRSSSGMPMETAIDIRMPGSKKSYQIWKNDVGSGQAGNRHFTIDLHQAIASALGWGGNADVEVAKAGTDPNAQVINAGGAGTGWTDLTVPKVSGKGAVADAVRAALKKATDAANKYGAAHVPVATGAPGTWGGGVVPGIASKPSNYFFPFPKGMSFQWNRIDQGQDLQEAPGGPVVAIAPGVVSVASDRFGGFGPYYATEQISSGPLAGRGVYYGHTKAVKTGPVSAGDVIAVTQSAADSWTLAPAGWLELGFLPYGSMTAGAAMAPILHAIYSGHYAEGGSLKKKGGKEEPLKHPQRGVVPIGYTLSELRRRFGHSSFAGGGKLDDLLAFAAGGAMHVRTPTYHHPVTHPKKPKAATHSQKARLKNVKTKHTKQKPLPKINLGSPFGWDQTLLNALAGDEQAGTDIKNWQSYLTELHGSGPQLQALVDVPGTDAQGNDTTTTVVNWDGMKDPSTGESLKGINQRLAELGVSPGETPPTPAELNQRGYGTELGVENMVIDALSTYQADAVKANSSFWAWLINEKGRGDLSPAEGGPDLDTKQINWLTDAVKLELPEEKMHDLFKDLGSIVVGARTIYHRHHGSVGPAWFIPETVPITKPWSTIIAQKMLEYRDASAKEKRLQAFKDQIPKMRRDRIARIEARFRRLRHEVQNSSATRTWTSHDLLRRSLNILRGEEDHDLRLIRKPHDWKGSKKAWTEQAALERSVIHDEFTARRQALQDAASAVGLDSRLKKSNALYNLTQQEQGELTVIRDTYDSSATNYKDRISTLKTNADNAKKWLNDLKGTISAERDTIKQDISNAQGVVTSLPDLVEGADGKPPMGSLALDLLTNRTIDTEPNLPGYLTEIMQLKGTLAPKAQNQGGGGGSGGDTGPSAADIAAAALADFQAFQESQAQLFTQFGSNYIPRGGNPFAGDPGISPGFQFYGAAGSDIAGTIRSTSNSNTTNIDITNHFGSGPPDAHSWAATQKFSVGALLG